MRAFVPMYNSVKRVVNFFSKQLHFDKYKSQTGRKLALPIEDTISLAVFKQKNNIATKRALYNIFKPNCSYKTLVVNLNRWFFLAVIIIVLLMKLNRKNAHPIKHIDSTELPVCLFKNANSHKTMREYAEYRKKGNTTFYGLKLHIITDLKRKLLSINFTGAKTDDREVVIKMSEGLTGIFIADAGYISDKLSQEFYQENKRILLVKPRSNMKKIWTEFENFLYSTRMLIEINFRDLKLFHGLVTSLPRSVDGYLANYIYSMLAYQIV
ncbi:MAG: transposase [Patescibacteria group bacterium]